MSRVAQNLLFPAGVMERFRQIGSVVMKSIAKYLLLLFVCIASLNTYAMAADYLVVVTVADGANVNAIADAYNGKVLDSLTANTYLMDLQSLTAKHPISGVMSMDMATLVRPGRAKGGVISVKAGTTPDWYYAQPALKFIGVNEARLKSTGKGVIIADINAAVDYSHPALRGHLTAGYDFVLGKASDFTLNQSSSSFLDQSASSFLDQSSSSFLDQSASSFLDQSSSAFLDQSSSSFLDQSSAKVLDATNPAHGHGTLVAGILVAVAPDAMIMPIRAFDDYGQADDFTIAKAIRWAVDHGADVINMSFGTLEQSKVLKDAVEYADKNHLTMIGSAGNNGKDEAQYPAAFDKVVSVAATDLFDIRASFSNFGDTIDVSAPGAAIIAPYPGGYYAVVSGTSFAAPIAAGEAALLRSLGQKDNAKDRIKGTAHKIDQANQGFKMGQGRIDLNMALDKK
jgi:subtilisin family serine protease